MSGSRSDWKKLLPIIEAFCKGYPVQRKSYDHRWKDTDTLTDMLHAEHRIKPGNIIEGEWSIEYTYHKPGDISGPFWQGTMTWRGTNEDDPPWPYRENGIEILETTEKFTEKKWEESDDESEV